MTRIWKRYATGRWLMLALVCLMLAAVIRAGNPLQRGLIGRYYLNFEAEGEPVLVVREQALNRARMTAQFPFRKEDYSIEWQGAIKISKGGEYRFTTVSDDESLLYIDDQLIVDNSGLHGPRQRFGSVHLDKGFHTLRIRYAQAFSDAEFRAYWTAPEQPCQPLSQAPLLTRQLNAFTFGLGHVCEGLRIISLVAAVLCGVLFLVTCIIRRSYRLVLQRGAALWRTFSSALARWFVTSRRGRWGLFVILAILLSCLIISIAANPLQRGLTGRYYHNTEWEGPPLKIARDYPISLWRMKIDFPEITRRYSIEWDGVMYIPETGTYKFTSRSDDGSEIFIYDQRVVDNRGMHAVQSRAGVVELAQGFHPLRIRYVQGASLAVFAASWSKVGDPPQSISEAFLFQEEPSRTLFLTYRIVKSVMFISVAGALVLVGLSICVGVSRWQLISPYLNTTAPGRGYARCCTWIFQAPRSPDLSPQAGSRKIGVMPGLLVFLAYLLITYQWTYPFTVYFSELMVGVLGDRYVPLWNFWWMKKAVVDLHTSPLFTDYLFYPEGLSLAFHDFSLVTSFVTLPLQKFFTLPEIYNLWFVGTYLFAGMGAFFLVHYLTGDRYAAFLAGLIYGFWGGRMYYVDQLSLATTQWFPYCALFVVKTFRERAYRNPVLAAIFLAIHALSSWYYGVYMSMFIGLFLLYHGWTERRRFWTRACLKRFILMGTLFLLLMSPILAPMLSQIFGGQSYMNNPVISEFSVNLNGLLFPATDHKVLGKYVLRAYARLGLPLEWGWFTGGTFPGYVVIVLTLYAIFRLKHLRQRRFWIFATCGFLLLAFGPHPQVFGQELSWFPLPYVVFQHLPILKILRVPGRFMVLVTLGGCVLAGYAAWDILRRVRFRKIIFLLLAVGMFFESQKLFLMTPLEPIPDFYQALADDPETYAILEVTQLMNWPHSSARASLFQTTHGKKLFHGHVSRVSPDTYQQAYALYPMFEDLFTHPSEYAGWPDAPLSLMTHPDKIQRVLQAYDVRYVTLYDDFHYGNYENNREILRQLFGEPVGEEGRISCFKVSGKQATENLVFPGFGIHPFNIDSDGVMQRPTEEIADIHLLNVETAQTMTVQFEAQSSILPDPQELRIALNDREVARVMVSDWQDIFLPHLPIQPGHNTLRLEIADREQSQYGVTIRHITIETL